MSFFKDFKEDFAQAMNELMPDSNEMYDEDELEAQETANSEPPTKKESPAVRKKTVKTEPKRTLKKAVKNPAKAETDMEIAPEDLADSIDELLEHELYGAQDSQILPDDMDVNTMDMSVEEMLSQLASKNVEEEEESLSVEAMLNQLDSPEAVKEQEKKPHSVSSDEGTEELRNSSTTKVSNSAQIAKSRLLGQRRANRAVHEEEVLNAQSEEQQEVDPTETFEQMTEDVESLLAEFDASISKSSPDNSSPEYEEEMEEETEEEEIAEEFEEEEEIEEVEEFEEAEEIEEAEELEEEEELEEAEELEEEEEIEEDTIEEAAKEDFHEEQEAEPGVNAGGANMDKENVRTMRKQVSNEQMELDDMLNALEQSQASAKQAGNNVKQKEKKMSKEKEVISINSADEPEEEKVVEEVKEEKAVTETKAEAPAFNPEDADDETTYVTKGTTVRGDLETDGSIDIIGVIEGNVTCKGKVVVGGKVVGDIVAGELYANNARIEGNVKSYGSVKVGVGSMLIGGVEGESAVIAGAVNGDIDVKGPVIIDSTAVIMGNIKSRSVQINNGAVIEGFCSQSYSDIDVKSFFA